MTERRSTVPEFVIGSTTWLCWVVDEQRYEWRSKCGRLFAGRYETIFWSRIGDKSVGSSFKTLRDAMGAAQDQARGAR